MELFNHCPNCGHRRKAATAKGAFLQANEHNSQCRDQSGYIQQQAKDRAEWKDYQQSLKEQRRMVTGGVENVGSIPIDYTQ